jgi:hypothetical protein
VATRWRSFIDDADRIKKWVGVMTRRMMLQRGTVTFNYYAATQVVTMFLARLLGNVLSTGPSSSANEIQTITVTGTPTAGTFILGFRGAYTTPLAYNISAAAMTTALEALPTIGVGNVVVTKPSTNYIITMASAFLNKNVPQITFTVFDVFVGGSMAISTTTGGGSSGLYTHTIRWPDKCALNPPSWPYVEGLSCGSSTGTYYYYPGGYVKSLSLEMSDRGWINLTVEAGFSGEEIPVSTFSFPSTESTSTFLLGNMSQMWLGDVYDDTTLIAADRVAAFSIKIDAGSVEPTRITKSVYVTEVQYGRNMPSLETKITLKGDKSAIEYQYTRLAQAGVTKKFKLLLDPDEDPDASLEFYMSSVTVELDDPVKEGREWRLSLNLMPLSNDTDQGPGYFIAKTNEISYLQAAP